MSAGEGQLLVMLPGFGTTPLAYRRTVDALAKDFRVVMPWLGGGRGRWEFEPLVDSVLTTLEAEEVTRPWLIGHSFGGAVALATAARAPERFAGLLLVDSLGASPGLARMTWLGLNPGNARLLSFAITRDIATYAATRPHQLARSAMWAYRCNLTGAIDSIRETELPRMVLWAQDDRLLPPGLGRQLALELEAPFRIVGTGTVGAPVLHDWPNRHPGAFAAVIGEILGRAPGTPAVNMAGAEPLTES